MNTRLVSRLTLVAAGSVTWLSIAFDSAAAETTRATSKVPRIIFNCDGNAVFKDARGDTAKWIDNLFEPLENTQVDALFWCDGAGGNTASYDSQVLELTGQRASKIDPHLKRLLAQGDDPPTVVIREARKRQLAVFYSFRINDIHDAFTPEELPTYKVEHPEWLIGEKMYGSVKSFATALNFALPEVRELKFRVIEELFRKYDFEGLEIDLLRSAPYFLPGEERENAHLLTELLGRVRDHLALRAKQRGSPIQLAVRVDESLRACELNGFDVPAWIEQGLMDILVLGSGVIDIRIEEFKKLAAPKGIRVYPCLYGWPSGYRPIPQALAAGIALNYWSQGADGIYLFNWFPHVDNNSEMHGPYMAELLTQLGDPQALRNRQSNLMFVADRGRPQPAYQYNWLDCVLPAALVKNKSVAVSVLVGDNLDRHRPNEVTLHVTVDHLQAGDDIRIEWNGRAVEPLARMNDGVLQASLSAERVRAGRNELDATLVRRSDQSTTAPNLTAVELHLTFASARRGPEDKKVSPLEAPRPARSSVGVIRSASDSEVERNAAK
ncbi:MAG: family 10 glycosylhydrolase [Planctomycetia bacterium]|nr:family 10 glycosylhydrolase [Planctomycetia bacterium]